MKRAEINHFKDNIPFKPRVDHRRREMDNQPDPGKRTPPLDSRGETAFLL